ncbi:hypothetical protein DL96DRAFT_1810811 [Flagelloscypha sp. PMI_526]|nr:hypothetical protein DL96DRAFT_1810811 [Flagelloscypha sp. PMI_526]
MPNKFTAIVIYDNGLSETFVGGELRWNNPTDELIKEAALVFEGRHIASIVSIGSGHPGRLSIVPGTGRPDLFSRIALDCERLANDLERRFANAPSLFWRLSVEQGLQNLADDLSNLDALVSHTYSYIQEARTNRDMDALVTDLISRPERILVKFITGEVPLGRKILRSKPCPQPTKYFTGRQVELQQLEDHFSLSSEPCHVAVLYGIGGGGKTQTGLEFIQRNTARFTDIFFVDASTKLTLENDLGTIAFGSCDQPSVHDGLRILRTREDNWLLFFDNADDPSIELYSYISFPHGNILITTRNRDMCAHAPSCSIWVDRMTLRDAKELLLRGVPSMAPSEVHEIVSKIVQELGCLALAINQARSFLAKGLCTLDEYLSMYKQNRKQLLGAQWGQKQTTIDAALLLQFLGFMHHEAIPARLFEDAWQVFKHLTAVDSRWNVLRFRTLIGEILTFSLAEFDPARNTLSLHPLVQQWVQSHPEQPSNLAPSTQSLLSLAIPLGHMIENHIRVRALLPHLLESMDTGITLHYTLLSRVGDLFLYSGLFQESCEVFQQQVSEMRVTLGAEHPETLASMSNLAWAYLDLGRDQDSLNLYTHVLELQKRLLGEEHDDTLATMSNLVVTYNNLNQHCNALELGKHVLDLYTRLWGEDHQNTLSSMSNLASVYSNLEQDHDAIQRGEQALDLYRKSLGEEHPNTLMCMSNNAWTYFELGRLDDALNLHKQVLKLRRKVLGDNHPNTWSSADWVEHLTMEQSDKTESG